MTQLQLEYPSVHFHYLFLIEPWGAGVIWPGVGYILYVTWLTHGLSLRVIFMVK